MTHYVQGHIITPRNSLRYNQLVINSLVNRWLRRKGPYVARYDKIEGVTTYSQKMGVQPFVEVNDKPRLLRRGIEGIIFDKPMSAFVTIESGSHVSILDKEAKEIYLASKSLYRLFAENLPGGRNIKLIFEDEHKRYSSNEFRRINADEEIPEEDEDPC
ncbi:MAG: hypothetical protein AABW79_02775 [Nanoarchaeota archaeon]